MTYYIIQQWPKSDGRSMQRPHVARWEKACQPLQLNIILFFFSCLFYHLRLKIILPPSLGWNINSRMLYEKVCNYLQYVSHVIIRFGR